MIRVEVEAGATEGADKEWIPDGGETDQLGDVDGIHAPGVVAPGVQAAEARRAATPGRPGLAADLSVEGGGVSERREDLGVRGVLDLDLPLVTQHPAGDAVILVHVHGAPETKEVVLVEVLGAEGLAAQDRGADGVGASGDHEDAAVEVGLRADLEVVPDQVDAGQEVGVGLPEAAALGPDHSLVGTDKADSGVLEGRDEVGEECGLPVDVVIDVDGDRSLDWVDLKTGAGNLPALIGLLGVHNSDLCLWKTLAKLVCVNDIGNVTLHFLTHSADDNLEGAIGQDSLTAFEKLLGVRSHGRDDDSHVTVGVPRFLFLRSGLVEETSGDEVDNESQVAKDEEENEELVRRREIDRQRADDAIGRED